MRAALYARVSTSLRYGRQDPETQLLPLREFCARRGWEVREEFVDDISAAKRRPAYDRMLDQARAGRRFDIIVTVRLDRMFRSMEQFVTTVRHLDSYGIRFLCTDQPIDTDRNDPAGQLLMHIIGAVAQFERALIGERVRAGIERARAQGAPWGGRKPRNIDATRVHRLKDQGFSQRKIAIMLNCSQGVIRKALARK